MRHCNERDAFFSEQSGVSYGNSADGINRTKKTVFKLTTIKVLHLVPFKQLKNLFTFSDMKRKYSVKLKTAYGCIWTTIKRQSIVWFTVRIFKNFVFSCNEIFCDFSDLHTFHFNSLFGKFDADIFPLKNKLEKCAECYDQDLWGAAPSHTPWYNKNMAGDVENSRKKTDGPTK